MSRPIITLTTDFGTADSYVAQMKGVMLAINPEAVLVDLTHAIGPQDVAGGARLLDEAVDAFPPHTIHLAVVDPGVGTNRALIGVEAGAYRFVAPNNGLLSPALRRLTVSRVHRLTLGQFRRSHVSTTFHGRDIMAPAAAHWSLGVDLAEFGPPLSTAELVHLPAREPTRLENRVVGEVATIDHFGNLITNIRDADLPPGERDSLLVTIGDVTLVGLNSCYAEAAPGGLLALVGSSGFLEIAVNGGSAATNLVGTVGKQVTLIRQPAGADGNQKR